jgi:membrane protease YdiL (CAAX protease family)
MMLHAYGSLLFTLVIGCVAVWGWISWRLFFRLPILPREPRYDVPWGLVDLLLAFALYLLLSFAAVAVVPIDRQPKKATEPSEAVAQIVDEPPQELTGKTRVEMELTLHGWRTMIALDSGIKLVVMLLMIVLIAIRLRATAFDFGLTLTRFGEDLRIGVLTFLAIYLPMIALQAALVYGLEWKYDHPLIKSVTETKDLLLFTLAGLAAAVVAPLFEEFVFRGLLQGWLEKLFAGHATGDQLLTGGSGPIEVEMLTAVIVEDDRPSDPNPYAPPAATKFEESFVVKKFPDPTVSGPNDWLAIVFSTLVFSLLHYSHGPAWIPLLIFGATLGWVYQRTHRLWPGIIAHMLLNATTMFGLWVQVFAGGPPG